jgi:hypothetical protein
MRFVYPYTVEKIQDGVWQIRFPDVPEGLSEGECFYTFLSRNSTW